MANFRDNVSRGQRKRKISGICPPGYHWVREHYASGKFGFRIKWVPGHCAKNGTPPEMQVTRVERSNKVNFLNIYKSGYKIVKEPLNNNHEEESKNHEI